MTRAQLEHIVRAAGSITESDEILVVGSQSILGSYPNAPAELTVSMEADVSPLNAPEKTDLISGSIGEITTFQDTYGYYAHGLTPDSCVLPCEWRSRLVKVSNENTRGYTALCLHPGDLACAKLAAGRDKDKDFVAAMIAHKLIDPTRIVELIATLENAHDRETAAANLDVCVRRTRTMGSPSPE